MFLGQYSAAIAAAEELIATVPEAVLRVQSPPMADFLEGYLTMKQHVLVRFGKWREIIEQKLLSDPDLYCSNVAMMHYAKAVAHSALGNVGEAEAEKASFLAAKARVPESRRGFSAGSGRGRSSRGRSGRGSGRRRARRRGGARRRGRGGRRMSRRRWPGRGRRGRRR